ncbi:MAG: WD40/YVTN/BNR-like repeat-containing protein [Steroidobacteraceae bacterium]
MTAIDRRPPAPRAAVGLSALLASAALTAALLAGPPPAQAQGIAAAAQVPFPQGHARVPEVQEVPLAAYSQLRWRLVGPFRGGWATMAAGVPASPDTFYFSGAGGGIWKTTDAGRTWHPIGNSLPPAIGALAVAPSAPDTIYVGTGQVAPRYDIAAGRGVFKSTDGGKTWQPLGLAATRAIGRIWVDPRNPDTVVVAALGHLFGPNPERGIYRSTDGGKSWVHALAINPDTGVVDLAADPANPNLLYAAAWQVRERPWLSYFEPPAGPGSAIYRSSDGGATWTRLSGNGWPQGALGRIGLAVTHTAQGTRIYATVASQTEGGVWRSDDGGDHWQRVNADADTFGNWYFSRLTVDPRNPDTVYSAGQSIRRSTDGGKTWTIIKGAPGGDDYHFVWINPKHPDHWITASDQGAVITVDDGKSWSSWYNQPTGQFYHLAADNRFPYWIYSGQQDSGTVGTASRGDYGAITFRDWHPVGGDERDYMLPDPDNPDVVFGSGMGGRVSRYDGSTGQVANVAPWPINTYAARPTTVKYRYGWVTPMAFTPTQPHVLLLGAQVLFRSTDGGDHWQVISPDLTGKTADDEDCTGKVAGEQAVACGYGVISAIAPSPKSAGLIWVGTDSGLVHLTRDGGQHWQNVTPPALKAWEKVSTIDASALDPASAYVAVDDHRQDDFRPHVFRTHDYGRTWTEADAGLPAGEAVPVVRADTVRSGLLYAGTSEGVYVSLDDGGHWQSLQLNLPKARVNDLLVHGDDLIAGTQGRAIWVLDDVTPLRQLSAAMLGAPAHLFAPEVAWRVHPNNNKDTPLPPGTPEGRNPRAGAVIDYWLGQGTQGPVTLEVYNFTGQLVRRFSSDEGPQRIQADRYFGEEWLRPAERLSAAPGMHRFVWNLRYARPQAISYDYSIAAVFGEDTPTAVEGPFVLPGIFSIVLTVNGQQYRAPLVVQLDPRVHTSSADLHALLTFSQSLCGALERASTVYQEEKPAHDELEGVARRITAGHGDKALLGSVEKLRDATAAAGGDADLEKISGRISTLEVDAESADLAPTPADEEVFDKESKALDAAVRAWHDDQSAIRKLNVRLRHAGLPVVGSSGTERPALDH